MGDERTRIAQSLHQWALGKMRYQDHRPNHSLPEIRHFKEICRGNSFDIWAFLTTHLLSEKTVNTIHGNISLSQARSKHSLENQKLVQKLEELRLRRNTLATQIQTQGTAIKTLESQSIEFHQQLSLSQHDLDLIQIQLQEQDMKVMMLEAYKAKINQKIAIFSEYQIQLAELFQRFSTPSLQSDLDHHISHTCSTRQDNFIDIISERCTISANHWLTLLNQLMIESSSLTNQGIIQFPSYLSNYLSQDDPLHGAKIAQWIQKYQHPIRSLFSDSIFFMCLPSRLSKLIHTNLSDLMVYEKALQDQNNPLITVKNPLAQKLYEEWIQSQNGVTNLKHFLAKSGSHILDSPMPNMEKILSRKREEHIQCYVEAEDIKNKIHQIEEEQQFLLQGSAIINVTSKRPIPFYVSTMENEAEDYEQGKLITLINDERTRLGIKWEQLEIDLVSQEAAIQCAEKMVIEMGERKAVLEGDLKPLHRKHAEIQKIQIHAQQQRSVIDQLMIESNHFLTLFPDQIQRIRTYITNNIALIHQNEDEVRLVDRTATVSDSSPSSLLIQMVHKQVEHFQQYPLNSSFDYNSQFIFPLVKYLSKELHLSPYQTLDGLASKWISNIFQWQRMERKLKERTQLVDFKLQSLLFSDTAEGYGEKEEQSGTLQRYLSTMDFSNAKRMHDLEDEVQELKEKQHDIWLAAIEVSLEKTKKAVEKCATISQWCDEWWKEPAQELAPWITVGDLSLQQWKARWRELYQALEDNSASTTVSHNHQDK